MSIIQLDKMTLYGAESRKADVVARLQELGSAHLVSLSSTGDGLAQTDVATDVRDALKYLRMCPDQMRQVRRAEQFERERVVSETLRLRDEEQNLRDERDQLQHAIQDMRPWGEFRMPAGAMIGDVRIWFYIVPIRDLEKNNDAGLAWSEVARDNRDAYVAVVNATEPTGVPGQRVQLDSRPLSQLIGRLEEVEEQLEDLHHQRVGMTRWCRLLASDLDKADDAAARGAAEQLTLNGREVFALQSWIPHEAADQMRRFADEYKLAISVEPPSAGEEPPTLLHNPEATAGGEGLVTFYKTPNYRAWDPSLVSYLSFAVFFAMILADAGYGIILAVVTANLWKKMGQTQGGRRGRNVLATLVGFTVVYGILCGSYFGVTPPPDSLLGRLRIIDAQSQELMMPLTIIIGVIHLSLANIVTAWLHRGRAMALASLGWVAVMAGAVCAGIGTFANVREYTAEQLTYAGTILLVGGLIAVFFFSSQRPWLSLSVKNHLLRLLDGLSGLTGLSGLFGDVLSYLRLFALGLSSAKLSETFNSLGASAWDNAGFGVIVAIAIVILGHTLNLLLSLMSGVVHGLRLNCIEFYKWSLPEEGYLFKAFEKKARQ